MPYTADIFKRGAEDWVPVSDAATVTDEPVRLWERRAAQEARESVQQGRPSRAVRARPPDGARKSVWWVRRSLHPSLSTPDTSADLERESLLAEYPAHCVERAYRKQHWLLYWLRLRQAPRERGVTMRTLADRVVTEARRADGQDFPISKRSLETWRKLYYRRGRRGRIQSVRALVDRRYGGGLASSGVRVLPSARDPRAGGHFLELVRSDRNLSLRSCHLATRMKADRKGWAWAAGYAATRTWWRRYSRHSTGVQRA